MLDMTVVILTKNEEKNIGKCIKSFDNKIKRFVIIDSFSTDNTKKICEKHGADFYENKWVDYATQLNWGLENTDITTKWTMRFDADEEMLPELMNEIELKIKKLNEDIGGIVLRRRVYFMGKWIKHGGFYPHRLLRIFRSGNAFCEQTIMDEHMILKSGVEVEFSNDFIDNNDKDLEWWISKHNWYSKREAIDYLRKKEELESDEIKPKFFGGTQERKRWFKYNFYYKTPLMQRARWYFIYRYIIRMGFLDGKEGLIFHFLQAYWYRFLVDAKLYEAEKNKTKLTLDGSLE